jgi:hypothetical protein
MNQHLTDAMIRKLVPPSQGMSIVWDDLCKGFGIRTTSSGARAFVLNYRVAGRQRQLTIGSHPDWSVSQARECARSLKRDIDTGRDPLGERQQALAAPTTRRAVIADRSDRRRRRTALKWPTRAMSQPRWNQFLGTVCREPTSQDVCSFSYARCYHDEQGSDPDGEEGQRRRLFQFGGHPLMTRRSFPRRLFLFSVQEWSRWRPARFPSLQGPEESA